MGELLQKDEVIISDILTASSDLFRRYGFKKTTMEDIARRIGKGKSSLYYYYSSKDEIFEAVVKQEMNEFCRQIQLSISEAFTAKQKLVAYCKARFYKLSHLRNLSEVLKSEIVEIQGMLEPIKRKIDTYQVEFVKKIIAEGVLNGEFKKINRENIELFSYLIVSSFRGLELPLVLDRKCPHLDQQIDSIVDIMVEGIGR